MRCYQATGSNCKRTIIVLVNENSHVKNLLKSTWGEAVHGWKIGVKNQMWQDQMLHLPQSVIVKCGGHHSWYGWNDHDEVGTISTTLKANNLPLLSCQVLNSTVYPPTHFPMRRGVHSTKIDFSTMYPLCIGRCVGGRQY